MTSHGAQGFSLISAIFLLVVLSVLGATLAQLSVTSSTSGSLALNATRALYAARSGAQWGAYRASLSPPSCNASQSFTLNEAALSGFNITVQCTRTQHQEGAAIVGMYLITATAELGSFGNPDFVSRSVEIQVIGQ